MADYFAANDLAAFVTLSGTPAEITTAGHFDASYTTKAISLAAGAIQSANFTDPTTGATVALTDFWFHMDARLGPNNVIMEFINSAGVAVLRLNQVGVTARRVEYWNGASWVTTGPTSTGPGDQLLHTYDFHIVCGAAGKVELYIDNSLAAGLTLNGLNAAVTNVQSIKLYFPSGTASYSQIIVSDVTTVGAKASSLIPNANSATNTAWANDFNNLNKNGYNDTTLVSSSTLNDAESYGATDVTLPTAQYFVSSVWMALRARLNSAAPANIKPLVRIGGVNYNGAYNFPGLNNVTFLPSLAAFPVDPSTGVAWSGVTNLNAAELGIITQT